MYADYDETETCDAEFSFWTPAQGAVVETGADGHPVPLPSVPLPIHKEDLAEGDPDTNAIGCGLYDYLRQYPDCEGNGIYAGLLRDAYSHYLADLGAQIVMLDNKEVDAPYIRRKITCMKILRLLDPENPGLQQQLGLAYYDLALRFTELRNCHRHLVAAMGYLQRSLRYLPNNPGSLNVLGQIDYLLGDHPAAARRWEGVVKQLEKGPVREALVARLERIRGEVLPDHPLVDDLEAIGVAMEGYGRGEVQEAAVILERLEEEGTIPSEFPSAEFYYLLGMCRGKSGDQAGAFAAFDQALELDPDYGPALTAKNSILNDGRV